MRLTSKSGLNRMCKFSKKHTLILFLVGFLVPAFWLFIPKFKLIKYQSQENQRVYPVESFRNAFFEPIKITNFYSKLPYLQIALEEKTVPVKLDLGFSGEFSLPEGFLRSIHEKCFIDEISYLGIRGKKYTSEVYGLPKIKIGRLSFAKAKTQVTNPEFEDDAVLFEEIAENEISSPYDFSNSGVIGWRLFQNFNLFLDFEHSRIAICDSLQTLRMKGYSIQTFAEAPLLLERNLVEFEILTENGPLRCMLDTGATYSFFNTILSGVGRMNPEKMELQETLNPENADLMSLNQDHRIEFRSFKIGEKDFGPIALRQINTPLDVDLIIGMDFLFSKLIFIDFQNRKIYFLDKSPSFTGDLEMTKYKA